MHAALESFEKALRVHLVPLSQLHNAQPILFECDSSARVVPFRETSQGRLQDRCCHCSDDNACARVGDSCTLVVAVRLCRAVSRRELCGAMECAIKKSGFQVIIPEVVNDAAYEEGGDGLG